MAGKRTFCYEKETRTTFKTLVDTFNTDPVLAGDLFHTEQYVECNHIESLEKVDGDTDFKPEQEKLTDTINVSMFNIYIQNTFRPRV